VALWPWCLASSSASHHMAVGKRREVKFSTPTLKSRVHIGPAKVSIG